METVLVRKEKKLLAHLLAAIADLLEAQGARDMIASLSKRIAEVICDRNLQIDTNLALMSLLEELSAWSVYLIETHVLKGTLELRAIETKVGKIPNYLDPNEVISALQSHSDIINGLVFLPPSPPPEDSSQPDNHCLENHPNLTAMEDPCVSVTTPSSLRSGSDTSDLLSSSSPGPFDNYVGKTSQIHATKILTPVSAATYSDEHDNTDSTTMKIDIGQLPAEMDLNRIATLTSTVIRLVDTATFDTYLTIKGTAQNCKYASEEIERVMSNLSVENCKRYELPSWMNGDVFASHIKEIAQNEGCKVEQSTDNNTNKLYLFIESSRGWNIRRCVNKLQEFEQKHSTNKTIKNTSPDVSRVSYDRSQLLLFRNALASIYKNDTPVLKELVRKAEHLHVSLLMFTLDGNSKSFLITSCDDYG